MFGGSEKKKTSLAARVKKLENKLKKKQQVAALKSKEAAIRKKLFGR